ncbi:MAG: N-acetyltransferase [Chloroflexi bacterium]|nr:MAG: N-acetyltransferase [Chloroflexota bacterium]
MTTLRGLLVDLVPFTGEYNDEKLPVFWNNLSRQWATMGDNDPVSRATLQRMQERRAEGRERGYTGAHFMMRARDGNPIGTIGLNWVDYWHRFAELGAWIGDEAYWGGGHGTDALLLIADYAFRWHDVRRLTLGTMSINERAQGNVEKVGFRLEKRARKLTMFDGCWVDGLEYGMLFEEWRGRDALVEELGLRAKAAQHYGEMFE